MSQFHTLCCTFPVHHPKFSVSFDVLKYHLLITSGSSRDGVSAVAEVRRTDTEVGLDLQHPYSERRVIFQVLFCHFGICYMYAYIT